MVILRDLLTPIQNALSRAPHMRGRERMFISTLLACIIPFTNSKSSNLLRSLWSLFGLQALTSRRFYSMMASSKLPWTALWRQIWQQIPDPATDGRLLVALDDSINTKTGKSIFACSRLFDHAAKANQSRYPWAQNVVMLGLLTKIQGRWSCVPLAFRFYLTLAYCKKWIAGELPKLPPNEKVRFRTKLEQAVQMLATLPEIFHQPILVVADSWFGNRGLLKPGRKELGDTFHMLSRLRCNTVLYGLTPEKTGKTGRPRKYGDRLGRVDAVGARMRSEAVTRKVFLYGKMRRVTMATMDVTLKSLQITVRVVWVYRGSSIAQFFTTDLSLSCEQIVEYYGARWKIEACFKELKQDVGSSKSQTQTEHAVKNHINFCMMATALTWIYASRLRQAPNRRFTVRGRTGFAFSDVRSIIAKAALTEGFDGFCHQNGKTPINLSVNDLLQMVA